MSPVPGHWGTRWVAGALAYELSAQLNGAASPACTALLRETTAAMVPATVIKADTAIIAKQRATPIHHLTPRSAEARVRRVSQIHMAAGMVLHDQREPIITLCATTTYTAKGVPQRLLINVKRSLKTGMALERIKMRRPVPTTHPL